MIQEKFTGYLF